MVKSEEQREEWKQMDKASGTRTISKGLTFVSLEPQEDREETSVQEKRIKCWLQIPQTE